MNENAYPEEFIRVQTGTCVVCEQPGELSVERHRYWHWKGDGQLIQLALPELSVAEREQLISGTHPACWDEMFPALFDESQPNV